MELIEVSGYVAEEKLNIAKRYIIPQVRPLTGLALHLAGLLSTGIFLVWLRIFVYVRAYIQLQYVNSILGIELTGHDSNLFHMCWFSHWVNTLGFR